jgi:hypothetical protein
LPEGEEILDLSTWTPAVLQSNIICDVRASASGVLAGRILSGSFESYLQYPDLNVEITLAGTFEAHLV